MVLAHHRFTGGSLLYVISKCFVPKNVEAGLNGLHVVCNASAPLKNPGCKARASMQSRYNTKQSATVKHAFSNVHCCVVRFIFCVLLSSTRFDFRNNYCCLHRKVLTHMHS